MSIKLPESVPIPQAGLMELLSGGIGQGISSALDQRAKLNQILALQDRKYQNQSLLQQIKAEAAQRSKQQKESTAFSEKFNKFAKGHGLDLDSKTSEERYLLNKVGSQRILDGEDPLTVMQDLLVKTSPSLEKQRQQEQLPQGTEQGQLAQQEQPIQPKEWTFSPDQGKRTLIGDIQALNQKFKEVEEKQSQLSLMEKLKGTAEIGQNIASGLTLGIIPKKELSEKYQHLQGASNFLKEVSSYVPLGELIGFGKNIATKGMAKLFPNMALATKIAGGFGGAAGGTAADTVSSITKNKKLPSAGDVGLDYAKWLAFETVFLALPAASKVKVTPESVNQFVKQTGVSKQEAANYLKERVKLQPAEGVAKESAQKATAFEKTSSKAPIGEEQLKAKEKLEKRTVQKAAKSPGVESAFKEEKEVAHRPETIAKEEARVTEVTEKIKPIRKQLQDASSEITELELKKRNAKSEWQKGMIQEKIDRAQYLQTELIDQVKALEHEIRHGTPPKDYKALTEDAEKSINKIKEDIKNPEPIDPAKAVRDLESHEKAIAKAEGIVKNGDLLSPEEIDYYTRLKKVYADVYKEQIKENARLIDELATKKGPKAKKQLAEIEQLNKILEQRLKRAEADILIQRNKKAIEGLSRGAKGAFFRKQLAELRQDVKIVKEGLFKQNKIKNAGEMKTTRATHETFAELQKNPTEANARKAAESQGMRYEDIKSDAEKLGAELGKENLSEAEKAGKVKQFLAKMKNSKVIGPAIYALNVVLKAVTGWGLPNRILHTTLGKVGAATILPSLVPLATKGAKWAVDKKRISELREIKDSALRGEYIKKLKEKGVPAKRINKIKEASKAH